MGRYCTAGIGGRDTTSGALEEFSAELALGRGKGALNRRWGDSEGPGRRSDGAVLDYGCDVAHTAGRINGVDDQRGYRATSAARISSIRSEVSLRPLRPAPAAPWVRRPLGPPKYNSMASRLISEMVTPRNSASCRRRASSASGIFTVLRFMYASMPCRTLTTLETGLEHLDRDVVPMGARQSKVAGQEWAVERLSQCDVCRVVARDRMPKLEGA